MNFFRFAHVIFCRHHVRESFRGCCYKLESCSTVHPIQRRFITAKKNVGMSTQTDSPLPYLFSADIKQSLEKPVPTKLKGSIPNWVKGSLYRNGSGLYRIGDTNWRHLFDGFAILHRWTIKDGQVTYLSTVLDSDHYKKSLAYNRIVGSNFGSKFPDPCKSIFHRFFSRFLPMPPESSDNTAVSIIESGDRLFALTETPIINEVDPDTMRKVSDTNIAGHLALHIGTAHPHFEKDGSILYYGTNMSGYDKAYNIVRALPPENKEALMTGGKIIATVPSRWKFNVAYNHSFGMTENYVIILELPFVMNSLKMLAMNMRGQTVTDCMDIYPDEKILIHVVDKKTGNRHPVTYQAPHGFVFHFINCYEEDNHIIADVCLANTSVVKDLYIDSLAGASLKNNDSYYVRYVLPLNIDGAKIGDNVNKLSGSSTKAVLVSDKVVDVEVGSPFGTTLKFDLPQINYKSYNGLKYRYAYGSTLFSKDSTKRILKLDVVNKTFKEWTCEGVYEPGEPVFVPDPQGKKEDDGVILCPIVSTVVEKQSYLVVLDASTFEELATATTPPSIHMNVTFHGVFTSKVF